MTEESVIKTMSNEQLRKLVQELQTEIFEKNVKLQEQEEEIARLESESDALDKLMGYSPNMSYEDKVKFNEESEKELEQTELGLDNSTKRIYENDMEKEDRLIDCALGINELQFEIAELFKSIKINIDASKHDEYKKHKRNFYALVDFFYNNYTTNKENEQDSIILEKIDIFDTLMEIIEKEKRVYELDEEIKNIK